MIYDPQWFHSLFPVHGEERLMILVFGENSNVELSDFQLWNVGIYSMHVALKD